MTDVQIEEETMKLSKGMNILSWILRLTVAVILFQTLFFKFTGATESVYIFSKLGAEPWGRIGSGVIEVVAVALLLIPSTVTTGAILSLGAAGGAIMSHLTKLGIVVINSDSSSDGGFLFALALIVFAGSAIILFLHRTEIPVVGSRLFSRSA
jgi:hypothetical protein